MKDKNKWRLAIYLINAKKDIDSFMYISKHFTRLNNINIREKTDKLNNDFYINLAYILDALYNTKQKKKDICSNDEIIDRIYYERDKNGAHKDLNYIPREFKSIEEKIMQLNQEINYVKSKCKEILLDNITLDFVAHDKELFRLIHRLNIDIENDLYKIKYPKGTFHSYDLTEEGIHVFKAFDTEVQDRENARMFGYDYDEVMSRPILQSPEDVVQLNNQEKERFNVLFDNGINSYEGLQNRQDSCVKMNLLYNSNMWVTPNYKEFDKIEQLKQIGFFDEFELVHWEVLEKDDVKDILNKIFNN